MVDQNKANENEWSINSDPLSTVTLGMLSWDTFGATEKEAAMSKFSGESV